MFDHEKFKELTSVKKQPLDTQKRQGFIIKLIKLCLFIFVTMLALYVLLGIFWKSESMMGISFFSQSVAGVAYLSALALSFIFKNDSATHKSLFQFTVLLGAGLYVAFVALVMLFPSLG